ncbi:MAG: hypothetical protein LBE79_07835, partial [Tannerella sp.]|nr:hypothetical protein [Tannerella sp.]
MKNKKLSISFVQRRVITSLITCLLLVAENKVQAATFFANDWTSLQTAITNALAHADPASTINITGGINLSSGLTIPAGADITLNYSGGNIYIQASGTITVASGASLTITGIQDAIVVSGGTFINNGNLTITSTNSGIRNGGTFTNNSTGKITLSTPNGRIENIGAFVNYGAIINNGIITETTTTTGSIINNGSITNNNVLENSTTLTNNGTITGNITNFNNRLIPQVDGTLTNNGTIDG